MGEQNRQITTMEKKNKIVRFIEGKLGSESAKTCYAYLLEKYGKEMIRQSISK